MKRGLAPGLSHVEPHLPLDCSQNRFHRREPDEKLRPKRESEHLSGRPHPQRKRGPARWRPRPPPEEVLAPWPRTQQGQVNHLDRTPTDSPTTPTLWKEQE